MNINKKEDITIEKHKNHNFTNLLTYYTEIAKIKDLNSDGSSSQYLEKQLNNIIIQDGSALNAFFTKNIQTSKCENQQTIYPFGINLSQRKAIKNVEVNQLSLIQGPPGTGKTLSILNILANLIIQEKTVAVVSSNNGAVKNVMDKMKKEGYEFLLALLGKLENRQKFFENQLGYPSILRTWKKTQVEMIRLLNNIKEHEENVVSLLEGKNRIAQITQLLSEISTSINFSQSI